MVQPKTRRLVTESALELFIDTQAATPVATIAELPTANASNRGLIRFVTAENEPFYSNGTAWSSIAQGAQGVPGPAGAGVPAGGEALQIVRKNSAGTTTEWVTPAKGIVGLSNVDNTSDVDKPVSSATQTALEAKASIVQLDTKADRKVTDVLYTDTSGYIFIVDQSTAAGSTMRYEDTPDHAGSVLNIQHRGGVTSGGQAYGINLANHAGARGAFIIHQYSKAGPAVQIDNTDVAAAIYVKNTPNTTQNPDGVQTGDFFQFKPGSETSNRLILQDNLTFWNQTSLDVTFQADNATTHALGVKTAKDIKGLSVIKTGAGLGHALEVDNTGTGSAVNLIQRGAGNAISVTANYAANAGKTAVNINAATHGAQINTNADSGSTLLLNKTATGLGDVLRILNAGTGPSIDIRSASGTVAKVNPNGEYENLTAGAGPIIKSPNGTRYRVTATNDGALALVAA